MLRGFNQKLLSYVTVGQESRSGLTGLLRQGPSQGFTWGVGQGSGLIWSSGEEGSTSKFIRLLAEFGPHEQQD